MTRLETVSKYIKANEFVLDVGADQAILSKILAKRGIYSIASDLRENIVSKAKQSMNDELKKFVTFKVADGVKLENNEKVDVLTICGMGTHTILKIIKNAEYTFKKIITISNNDHSLLRKEMNSFGYKIELEEIIKDKGKYYNLIMFTRGKGKYTKNELIIGINHQNIALLKERNQVLINKYENILKKVKNKDLEFIVNTLRNYEY